MIFLRPGIIMSATEELISKLESLFEVFPRDPRRSGDMCAPLVSPWTVRGIAEVLLVDLAREPYQVTNMKTFLKTFLLQYRLDTRLDPGEVESCLEMIEQERIKHRNEAVRAGIPDDVNNDKQVQFFCVECGVVASRYCTVCRDCLCTECSNRIHKKGSRSQHHINEFLPCSLCTENPSRLQCSYTFLTFCSSCFSKKHAKTLPTHILDLRPLRIDYSLSYNTLTPGNLGEELISRIREPREATPSETPGSTPIALGPDWHPFIDASGVQYYYNFKTRESMRRVSRVREAVDPETSERVEQSIRRVLFTTGPKILNLTM